MSSNIHFENKTTQPRKIWILFGKCSSMARDLPKVSCLIADSLPDAWGARMLQNEIPGLQTVLGQLAAIGQRRFGAITFEPVLGAGADQYRITVDLAGLGRDADALRASPVPLSLIM